MTPTPTRHVDHDEAEQIAHSLIAGACRILTYVTQQRRRSAAFDAMLSALRSAADVLEQESPAYADTLREVRAAIAKATVSDDPPTSLSA